MVQSTPQVLTVNEFLIRYGDDQRYELIDGELIDVEPTGLHEEIAALIGHKLNVEIDLSRSSLLNSLSLSGAAIGHRNSLSS